MLPRSGFDAESGQLESELELQITARRTRAVEDELDKQMRFIEFIRTADRDIAWATILRLRAGETYQALIDQIQQRNTAS